VDQPYFIHTQLLFLVYLCCYGDAPVRLVTYARATLREDSGFHLSTG